MLEKLIVFLILCLYFLDESTRHLGVLSKTFHDQLVGLLDLLPSLLELSPKLLSIGVL